MQKYMLAVLVVQLRRVASHAIDGAIGLKTMEASTYCTRREFGSVTAAMLMRNV